MMITLNKFYSLVAFISFTKIYLEQMSEFFNLSHLPWFGVLFHDNQGIYNSVDFSAATEYNGQNSLSNNVS